MTRTDWNILMLSIAAAVVVVIVFAAVAQAAPVHRQFGGSMATCIATPEIQAHPNEWICVDDGKGGGKSVRLGAPPIRIQCPCDLHVRQQDGVITLSGAGTLTVGPKTTDYSGGHWESDAPVSFDNHAPEPKPERDR